MSATSAPPVRDGESLAGEPLLRVDHVVKTFSVPGGTVQAVSDVSFDVRRGETVGLVGESGCGKSTLGRVIVRLYQPTSGRVLFEDRDLAGLSNRELRQARSRLQIIFQDPISALNPRRKVREIVAEGLVIAGTPKSAAMQRVDAVLREVGLDPERVAGRRPHEFSGGQCQRIAIARAMALGPNLLVCDEPVASLDVSIQAQVLNLLEEMKAKHDLALVFIAHDLAVVRNISDRVAVMYLGKIVEMGPVESIYTMPAHHYTRALLDAVPVPNPTVQPNPTTLHGEIPSPLDPPTGCRFRTRCPRAEPVCAAVEPPLLDVRPGQSVACHFPLLPQNGIPDGHGGGPDLSGDKRRAAASAGGRPEQP